MSVFTDRIRLLLGRRKAYAGCFLDERGGLTESGRAVMADLRRFCRVETSSVTVSPVSRTVDTHATMVAEGRREVYNRLLNVLHLTEYDIHNLVDRPADGNDTENDDE
ncbi:Bbp19 family protein [Chitinasiproducens palmae]|uniref:Bbp19-like phage domain-containing protein n=1 Tax=Chitinasiproducens palmae TaxID=1770053 RepID=A0A1H2PQZ9_9BURK|nr:hypothetical protein [Chitinasiproducens palmae]SDV49198.1 hypothetical protein SAMN05216551_107146 [Chitinasiproducens palmae]